MSAQHTAGPWITTGADIWGPVDNRSKHKNCRVFVASVPSAGARVCPWVDNGAIDEQAAADANLIAAAPKLLAACKRAESVLRTFRECGGSIAPEVEQACAAAILAAEGGK